ncbi:MAG: hypothetical protein ABJB85_07615 [Nitrososphaerota archaeon]
MSKLDEKLASEKNCKTPKPVEDASSIICNKSKSGEAAKSKSMPRISQIRAL